MPEPGPKALMQAEHPSPSSVTPEPRQPAGPGLLSHLPHRNHEGRPAPCPSLARPGRLPGGGGSLPPLAVDSIKEGGIPEPQRVPEDERHHVRPPRPPTAVGQGERGRAGTGCRELGGWKARSLLRLWGPGRDMHAPRGHWVRGTLERNTRQLLLGSSVGQLPSSGLFSTALWSRQGPRSLEYHHPAPHRECARPNAGDKTMTGQAQVLLPVGAWPAGPALA